MKEISIFLTKNLHFLNKTIWYYIINLYIATFLMEVTICLILIYAKKQLTSQVLLRKLRLLVFLV